MHPTTALPPELLRRPFTVAEARAVGVPARRTYARDLARPFYGVRTRAVELPTVRDRCEALAVRMPETQYFSHVTAALLYGIPLPQWLEVDPHLHVTTVHSARAPRLGGVIGHTVMKPTSQVRLDQHLPVLAPAFAWCQLAPMLSLDQLIAAGDRLLGRPIPLATPEEVEDAVRAHGSRRGAHRLREAFGWLRPRVESPRETRLRLAVIRAGLPEPQTNVSIRNAHGVQIAIGDLVFPAHKVLLEYDGEQHRVHDGQYARDVVRLNDLAADEWIVIRVDKHMSDSDAVIRTRAALVTRSWRA
jgi:hypothetical protein